MRIKLFLILVYGVAGLFISSITAFMTFIIIEEPIGYKMGSKIVLTVVLTLPIIILISGIIGELFARQINSIINRLREIKDGERNPSYQAALNTPLSMKTAKYNLNFSPNMIIELADINNVSNQLDQEISTLLTSLRARNEELTMMLLTFSHDVRTPLMISNGYIEELEDNMIPPNELLTVYKKLKTENAFINDLCNDILTYQHLKAQTKRINEDILVLPIADNIITLLDAKVTNDIEPTFTFNFDPIDLKKILMNLLQNSIKYAQSEKIRIYNRDRCIIVEDYGIGIEAQYQKKIFEPFYTIDSSKNRKQNGFGLGLAITKILCQQNQCHIKYDSSYQAGARFILSPNE